jgi:hypothetical protein
VLLVTTLITALAADRFIPGGMARLLSNSLAAARFAIAPRPANLLSTKAPYKKALAEAPSPVPQGAAGEEPVKLFMARVGEEPGLNDAGVLEPENLVLPDGPILPIADIAGVAPDDLRPSATLPFLDTPRGGGGVTSTDSETGPEPGPGPGPGPNPTIVPEPSTWFLLIAGFGLLGGMLRRRNRRSSIEGAEVIGG